MCLRRRAFTSLSAGPIVRRRNRIPTISTSEIATAALRVWQLSPLLRQGLDTGENPARVWFYEVSGNYFDALGVRPYLGRLIHPSDEHGPSSAPYIVLTYAYWHTHFQDDPGVVSSVDFTDGRRCRTMGQCRAVERAERWNPLPRYPAGVPVNADADTAARRVNWLY